MIAEFYGLSGSGKTTLVNLLCREEGRIQIRRHGRQMPKGLLARNLLSPEYLGFARRCAGLYLAKQHRDASCDGRTLRAILRLYLIYMWEREHPGEYRCYDQGIVQECLTLIWTEYELKDRAMELVEYLLEHMQGGVMMIYTHNADHAQIYDRVVQRQEYRRIQSGMSREQAGSLMAFQAAFFDRVHQAAAARNMGMRTDTRYAPEIGGHLVRRELEKRLEEEKC